MILYKAKINWYDEYQEEDHDDIVIGFAEDLGDFANKVNKEFHSIDKVEITVINTVASDNQLLYVANDDIDTVNAIEKENDY